MFVCMHAVSKLEDYSVKLLSCIPFDLTYIMYKQNVIVHTTDTSMSYLHTLQRSMPAIFLDRKNHICQGSIL